MKLLPLVLLSAAAVAQSPLSTPFVGGNGQAGNQFDLVATNPVVITTFDVNISAGTWDLEVYAVTGGGSKVGVENTAAAWTLVATAPGVVSNGANVPTPLGVNFAVPIAPGQTQGFYVTLSAGGTMNYTNGTTPQGVLASNADLTILEGTGHSYPFGSLFNPRNFNANIYYSVGAGTAAFNTVLGAGCGGNPTFGDGTVYQLFDGVTDVFDLSNTSMTYSWFQGGYAVLPLGTNAIVPPTGGALTLGDDIIVPVALPFAFPCPAGVVNQVFVCSNGFIGFQPGLGADFSETSFELLSQQNRLAFLWDDLNPAAGGTVNAEAVGAEFHITFTDVPEFGTTNQNSCQVVLSPNGDIDVRYGAVALLDCLVGLSSGNGATDPGSLDLSDPLSLPVIINTGFVVQNLGLSANSRPLLGASWDLQVDNIPASTVFGFNIFGTTDPAILDLAFVGMPGCQLRTDLGVVAGPWVAAGSSFSYSLALPAAPPALLGQQLFTQAATLSNPPVNAFGAITSNGIRGTLGDI